MPVLVTIPHRTVATEEDLDRAKRPSEHLVQPVGQVNRGRSFECRSPWHAVDGAPSPAVHLEPGENVLRDRPIDPTQLRNLDNEIIRDSYLQLK